MQVIKNLIKKALHIHPTSGLTPLPDLDYLGSPFFGYYVPRGVINENSTCYCVGAGQDISFDTELVRNYNCSVVILDPAPEGIEHYNLMKDALNRDETFTTPAERSKYTYRINKSHLPKLSFIQKGVWNENTTIRLYSPGKDTYISHSAILFKDTGIYIEAPVDRISNIMKSQGHKTIDLLKLEIEGAEYKVIESIAEDKPDIKMITVEFDEVHHCKGFGYLYRIRNASQLLINNGYKLVHSTDFFKRLFVRNDVYQMLLDRQGEFAGHPLADTGQDEEAVPAI